jgi:2-polyprenyl-6-methoxyphenol hydroxylase-like FAD-dependent oxidoreductase
MWAICCSAVAPFYGQISQRVAGRSCLAPATVGTARPGAGQQSVGQARRVRRLPAAAGQELTYIGAKPPGCRSPASPLRDLWWGKGRVFTAGEAAGLVSPSSGDGISYSLQSAAAFAMSIAAELDGNRAVDDALAMDLRARIVPRALAQRGRPARTEVQLRRPRRASRAGAIMPPRCCAVPAAPGERLPFSHEMGL